MDVGVVAQLHFNECRPRVLINDQMVERPTDTGVGSLGNPLLAGDQNPATSIVRPHLLSVDQLGMLSDQLL